ncbi:MAG: TonB-dependent receptor plug domain-containing protein [Flavobacteriaceae bacterium]|jgi:hypothetical protein|nr:TonB-dependent receptor plug domain-containing protein [Flavobacteriaceae bacterium]
MHLYNKQNTTFLKTLLFVFTLFYTSVQYAQGGKVGVDFFITNNNKEGIPEATLIIKNAQRQLVYITDEKGYEHIVIEPGVYTLEIFHISYKAQSELLTIAAPMQVTKRLEAATNQLQEVVITAQEGKGLSTKSVINRKAMEHLQPSSFSDLMELLPGGLSKTPTLTSNNRILIREFGQSGQQYETSSLGVQFVMDGVVQNSNVDLQTAVKDKSQKGDFGSNGVASKRYTNESGVDMRTISTNDIESVEIIRGIPTVSYGDLTSGLVIINRKTGQTKWQGRVKADGFSKMGYVSKGFSIDPTWDLNVSFDYLNALSDPRDLFEVYQRVSSSVRSTKRINFGDDKLVWKTNIDYKGTIDQNKSDPDSGYNSVDSYRSSQHSIGFSNILDYTFGKGSLFDKIKLTTNVRQGIDDIKQTLFVQYSGPRAVSIAQEAGVNEGYYPELSFVSNTFTEGRPIDVNAKLETNLKFSTYSLKHAIEAGIDYKYSYNYGRGQMYDLLRPISEGVTTRPRAFSDVPAFSNIALFLGDNVKWNIGKNALSFYGGVRVSKMLGMDSSYALSNKVYIEPRFITQWELPKVVIGSHVLKADVTLGYGELYKQPTSSMLYPNKMYSDFQQLNFHHINPEVRTVNFMTFVDDLTNKSLVAAKNTKKEIRLDLSYAKHEFFINYFDEDMPTGFRYSTEFRRYDFKRYDTSGLNLDELTTKPSIEDLPYRDVSAFGLNTYRTNGSKTYKKGIEFGYTSPRFPVINTRFTLSGAWFKTLYTNTVPSHEKPNKTINGISFPYVGIYANDTGFINSGMNYNLIVDTYLPALDMNISASLQGMFFRDEERAHREAAPYAYYGVDKVVHPYLDSDCTDMYKQWLVRDVSISDNRANNYKFDIRANLKVTKRIYENLRASLFVNKVFSYIQPYYFDGVKVERKDVTAPYFGMELTYNF